MKENMERWTKAQLWDEMKRVKKIIIEIGKPADDKGFRLLMRYKNRYIRAKRHFYECGFCADATTETYTDAKGDEKDRFVKGCGLPECPYHDYFIDQMNGAEDEVIKGLKVFLSRY